MWSTHTIIKYVYERKPISIIRNMSNTADFVFCVYTIHLASDKRTQISDGNSSLYYIVVLIASIFCLYIFRIHEQSQQ